MRPDPLLLRHRTWAAPVVAIAALTLLGACGGGGGTAAEPADGSAVADPTPTSSSTTTASGEEPSGLCALLLPDDIERIVGPGFTSDGTSTYCSYSRDSENLPFGEVIMVTIEAVTPDETLDLEGLARKWAGAAAAPSETDPPPGPAEAIPGLGDEAWAAGDIDSAPAVFVRIGDLSLSITAFSGGATVDLEVIKELAAAAVTHA